uniref:Cytochrome P450, family 7, subfamily B, polypeptide 1 n=1 Tax=Gasterosteus aculeatus aculeatus TaxID=481459 RepID=A0AAQ4PMN5_GASAC
EYFNIYSLLVEYFNLYSLLVEYFNLYSLLVEYFNIYSLLVDSEFGRDAHKFLEEHKKKFRGRFHSSGYKYMTFVMDPLLYPSVIRHGRQLDFHEFSDKVAPVTFGYPPIRGGKFPGLPEQIGRTFQLLQGDGLSALTESMMSNLLLLFRQDHLGGPPPGGASGDWRSAGMYEFCNSIMFEATFLTIYGRPASASRHSDTGLLRRDFVRFDNMFPLLIAQIPIRLLGRTKAVRDKLIDYFLPHRMSRWADTSLFIRTRSELFEQYDALGDVDKAAQHFAILWASVGNTIPATFWAMYHLARHPEALREARREIQSVLGLGDGVPFSSSRDVRLDREQLEKLVYLESAISESLRLSSASMNIRVAQEDFSLRLDAGRSVAVRRGDFVALYPQTMHMDPEIYEEPQSFRADRFLQDGVEKTDFYKDGQRLRYYLMPFGSGSSRCPGRFFAVNEIKQFLCVLLLCVDLQLEDGQAGATLDASRAGLGILLPAADVRFRYRPRNM